MAKSRKLEELVALLNQIQNDPTTEEAIATLGQVLNGKYPVAVARAAKIISGAEIRHLIPNLVAAFARFMVSPETTDQGCIAKKAIAEALYKLEYSEESLFLSGIRHVQMEPVWGGKEDTAAELRGTCALGLVRMNYAHVMVELADLLADPKSEARIVAARAIAYTGDTQGVPLLRLKVLLSDTDPQVLAECFAALLKLAPAQSLPLVSTFLDAPDAQICEMAALALGESRLAEAFTVLHRWWTKIRDLELRKTALLAIAMLRHDSALDFLLSLIVDGNRVSAEGAIAALSIYRQDVGLWQRVNQAVEQRPDASLLKPACV